MWVLAWVSGLGVYYRNLQVAEQESLSYRPILTRVWLSGQWPVHLDETKRMLRERYSEEGA